MKIIKGDLLELAKKGKFDVIIHGCNCFHSMGAGIALQIATKFPEAFEADKTTKFGDLEKLGTFSMASVEGEDDHEFLIVNAYTQFMPGADCNYGAINDVFALLSKTLPEDSKIGYPLIGAGIAGGDWNTIKELIDDNLQGFNHTLVKFVPPINKGLTN
jgi:O-acetyl-ADP-ribose deacetylase (regulator of RNase III)